jgi:hypothetical protein
MSLNGLTVLESRMRPLASKHLPSYLIHHPSKLMINDISLEIRAVPVDPRPATPQAGTTT